MNYLVILLLIGAFLYVLYDIYQHSKKSRRERGLMIRRQFEEDLARADKARQRKENQPPKG